MGNPAGGNLGQARGSITVDTSQLAAARAAVNAFATGVNTDLTGINRGAGAAQRGITSLTGSFGGLAGALGVRELARFAVEVNAVATAFDRQAVAARSLAGSQEQVNALIDAYTEATGGAIDKATTLSDVTRLIAVGFADNVEEIEEFTRAVRGISIATGRPQDFIVTNLQLELLNQTGFRLDQIGLGMEEVRRKADALRAANQSLTQEQAYQQAVIATANDKYGDLTKSIEAQATGVEHLARSWKDFRLEVGQLSQGPINFIGEAMANWLDQAAKDLQVVNDALVFMGQAIGLIDRSLNRFGRSGPPAWMTGVSPAASFPLKPESTAEQNATRRDWAQGVIDLQRRTNLQLAEENSQYLRNRANAERDYQQTVEREAQDFILSRQRQEQDLVDSIAAIHRDASRREQRAAEDLAETITEARDNTNERLADLEEDYQRDREKRARKHRDDILDAAGRLDAKAVADAQRNFRRQEQDAKESYDEQRKDLQDQFREREEEARKSYERQLQDAREADAQRIQDMQDDFAKRQAREDEDRAIRLGRMAEDHAKQLVEMDRAHQERISQIARHAREERTALDDKAKEELIALGVRNEAWITEQKRKEKELEKIWDDFWDHVRESVGMASPRGTAPERVPAGFASGGFVPRDMLARLHAGEVVIPASQVAAGGTSNNMNMGGMTFNIYAAAGQSPDDIAAAVDARLRQHLTEWAA